MNLLCLFNDNVLYSKLKNTSLFEHVTVIGNLADLKGDISDIDVMVFSDRIVSFDILPDLRDKYPNIVMFFMVSDSSNSKLFNKIETMCNSYDINIVFPHQTQDQILSLIQGVLKPRDNFPKNHVTTFIGARPRVGTTSIVLSVATRLGMLTDSSIGVLCFNSFNSGTVFLRNYEGQFLDELKTFLGNKMLMSKELFSSMYNYNNFYYLAGNRDIKKRLHYSIEEAHYLVEQAKKLFDLVLIDGGSCFDDALCIQSLLNSDNKFLVTDQLPSSFTVWNYAYEQVLGPGGFPKSDFLMIINNYKSNGHYPDSKQIAREYGIPYYLRINDIGDFGLLSEINHTLPVEYNEPDYIRDIDFIAKGLIKSYRLKEKDVVENNRVPFLKRIFNYGG